MKTLRKLVGTAIVAGFTTLAGWGLIELFDQPRTLKEFTNVVDLNNDTNPERIRVESKYDSGIEQYYLFIQIDELAQAKSRFLSSEVEYDNRFYKPWGTWLEVEKPPMTIDYKDTNSDNLLDMVLVSRGKNNGLETRIVTQDGKGYFNTPEKSTLYQDSPYYK